MCQEHAAGTHGLKCEHEHPRTNKRGDPHARPSGGYGVDRYLLFAGKTARRAVTHACTRCRVFRGVDGNQPLPPHTLYFQTFLHAVDTSYFRKQFLLRAEMTETTARQDL